MIKSFVYLGGNLFTTKNTIMEEDVDKSNKEIIELLERIKILEEEVRAQEKRIARLEREVVPLKVI
jgi:flagellar motility protein MotE (MotC chaperone)